MKRSSTVLLLFTLIFLPAVLRGAIPASERQALIAFYASTGGDSWTVNTGWKTEPLDADGFALPGTENTWYGVTTDSSNSMVTALILASNNLVGSLPAGIGDLPNLTILNVRGNRLSGSLPAELWTLTNLTVLQLYQNEFSGTLAAEIGDLTNLTALNLYANQLTGSLPSSLGNLVNLQTLSLYSNQLSGEIPVELGNLVNLTTLDLHSNQLSGSIPSSLGGLSALRDLFLHSNALTGSLPTELGNLTSLRKLYLRYNQLTGSIPASFGGLAYLQEFVAGNNLLSGSIPTELGGLAALTTLDLRFNELEGSIPASFSGLSSIRTLYLQFNNLTGSLPVELGGLTTLTDLRLQSNQLTGTIPAELGNLTNLVWLYIHLNQLSGAIPTTLANLTKLGYLHLYSNQLTGSIPPELGTLSQLVDLTINSNALEGSIPAELGNLTRLQIFNIYGNKLSGAIPASLTNLTALVPASTNLGYNALYSSDGTLTAFLNAADPDWASTQTVAPSSVTATSVDGAGILISWSPIAFSGYTGYYQVFVSETAGGPYTAAGQTANKTTSSLQLTGFTPGRTYYFVVRTHTDAHAANANALDSLDSAEASATAWTQVNVRITGTILAGESPLAGVVLSGLAGDPMTNALGVYDVTASAGWSGMVTPTLAGYTFTPASRTYASVTEDQLNQDYAAALVPATITVTSPNGGEAWTAGTSHAVTWTSTGLADSVTIDLYKGGVYSKTLGTAAATAGTFAWTIASNETAGTDYRVLVWQGSVSDDSDADFTVTAAVRVDFNKDGREDLLWRYYGTGGRNRAWLLGATGGTALLLAGPDPELQAGATAGGIAGSAERIAGMMGASRSGKLIVADPRDAVDPRRWREGRKSGAEGRKGTEGSDPEMSALPLSAGVSDPGLAAAVCAADPAMTIQATALLGGGDIPAVSDMTWQIVGTGDFNNDGSVDVLWRYNGAGGKVRVWYMSGTTLLSGADITSVSDLSWQVAGTGDFNKDGHVDILWRYNGTGGQVRVWYMNGISIIGGANLCAVPDLNWQVGGTGDFNKDGSVDILWRYNGTGGRNRVWYMNGVSIIGGADLLAVSDLNWQIGGVADYSGDGNVDVVWRYAGAAGYVYVWDLNGIAWTQTEKLAAATDQNWKIVSR
ncbi:MAG TPA: FG-GAP-like repeat-containing protein [Candidatus Aminicenantes bacterium]|nr:FG-GAP-like repeat-containing protein [Candidatus Aminicenantes bacterium]